MNNKPSQWKLDDLLDAKPPTIQEQKKREQKLLVKNAITHLETFISLYPESTKKNSISLKIILALVYHTLVDMEKDQLLYLKTMKNGDTRIFKKYYYCRGLEEWKKCPEYRCPVWPCIDGTVCPHDETIENDLAERDEIKKHYTHEVKA